jgi:hypothetical protein
MSSRLLSAAAWLAGLASAGLLTYAGYDSWDASRTPEARVEVADLVVDGAPAGVTSTVEYVLVNSEADPLRLVGAESC